MDSLYIQKLANFNKTCSDVEGLKDKLTKENKKLIQLRIDQSTAYHQLREKYDQLQTNNENLQQNLLETQMQLEKTSEEYMKEKRRRLETFNKASSAMEMCQTLVHHTSKSKETLNRGQANQVALCETYDKGNQVVKDLIIKHEQAFEKKQTEISNLEAKVVLIEEYSNQMKKYFEESTSEANSRLSQMESELKLIKEQNEELTKEAVKHTTIIETHNNLVEEKDKLISSMDSDMNYVMNEAYKQRELMEAEMKIQMNLRDKLNKAVAEQEVLIKELQNDNNELRERNQQIINQTSRDIENLQQDINKYKELVENIRKDGEIQNDKHAQDIKEFEQLLLEKDLEMGQISKDNAIIKLDAENKEAINVELKNDLENKEAIIIELKEELETQKNIVAEKEKALIEANNEIINLTNENDRKMNDILDDWKKAKDESYALNTTIQKQFAELEDEKTKYSQLELKYNIYVEQTDQLVSQKDETIEKAKNNILDLTAEKEDLQMKVAELKRMLDDMRLENEVTSLRPFKAMSQQDENAVMGCPSSFESQIPKPMIAKKSIYNFQPAFSDSSEDAVNLNLTDMSRMFITKCANGSTALKRKLHPMPTKTPQTARHDTQQANVNKEAQKPKNKIFKTRQHQNTY